jgi:hypothetical protein
MKTRLKARHQMHMKVIENATVDGSICERRPMRKVFALDEGEATLTFPDRLSIGSCEKLEASITSLLRATRGRAMVENKLTKLGQSMAEKISNDDAPAP